MELDELKTLWQQTDRRLESMAPALRLQERLARAGALDRARSKNRFTRVVLWYEVAFGAVAALLAGSYLTANLARAPLRRARGAAPPGSDPDPRPRRLAAGGARPDRLWRPGRGHPAPPREARCRPRPRQPLAAARFTVALGALVVVVPHGLVGLDVYRAFGIAWVGGNFLVGLAVLAAGLWASRSTRFASLAPVARPRRRPDRTPARGSVGGSR